MTIPTEAPVVAGREVSDNEAIMFALVNMQESCWIKVGKDGVATACMPSSTRDVRAAAAYNKLVSWLDSGG